MSQKIVDYTLDKLAPTNPDGSLPATVSGCVVDAGPGVTVLGNYPQALNFQGGGKLTAALPVASLNSRKFCLRVIFRVDGPVTGRQNLLESNALPVSFYLTPGTGSSAFNLEGSVKTRSYGVGKASSAYMLDLQQGVWYAADLVYDTDTLAVFVNNVIYSVHAFPDGTLASGTGDQLFAATAENGSFAFGGLMALIELHDDIPIELESQLDERRAHPQWHLTYKQEEIKSSLAFGDPLGEFYYDFASTGWIQPFPAGLIMYQDANGLAFEMHGDILRTYQSLPNRAELGYLVSDEINAAQRGSRKSLFSGGGIYWSSRTGAIAVTGQMWVDYEGMGESRAIGLPAAAAVAIGGGKMQVFQRAQMYWRSGSFKAFIVLGAILAKFLATGGTATWGFPVSDENDLLAGAAVIGRISEFQNCTIYWSASSGAAILYGEIRDKYRSIGGPGGRLGFPTSDEADVPGAAAPARINAFQHGSIVWFGSAAETYVCEAFDIVLGTVDTKESEGWGRGQNDIYMWATIDDNGTILHNERIPGSGDRGGHNVYPVDKRFDLGPAGIIPNAINRNISFTLDVKDSDWPDDDDHLGHLHASLNAANAWGLRGNPLGLMNSGSFDNINNISWAVAPHVDAGSLLPAKKWWGVKNRGTDPITYHQYATAFRDVDSEPEWWDIPDWLKKLFYEVAVKGVAKSGNCFGMSLEAIYSKKDRALLTMPIDRFNTWDATVSNEFNIKHQYQVGASAIWWFVAEFLSGQTHDPVSVFKATRSAFNAGCDPVVCIAQNYDFSGAPHCILPVGWNDTVTPWELQVRDPNYPTLSDSDAPRILYVDPVANTFHYDGGNVYDGGEWSGGRFHYMPFDLLNGRPRTPVYEAIMLLLTGVVVILGGDSQTSTLTDENGVDLDAFGADSIRRRQAGRPLTNKFVPVKGFDRANINRGDNPQEPDEENPAGIRAVAGEFVRECAPERVGPRPVDPSYVNPIRPRPRGVLSSEIYFRSNPRRFSRVAPPNKRAGNDWTRLTLKEYLCQVAPAPVRETFRKYPDFVEKNQGRQMLYLVESDVLSEIFAASRNRQPEPVDRFPAISPNFIHETRVLRGGRFEYVLKQGLSQVIVTAEAGNGEQHTVQVKNLGTYNNIITLSGYREKVFNLQVHNKLGVGADYLRMELNHIPMAAGGSLELNIKPGIGGVELFSAGQEINATVNFEYVSRGASLASRFMLREQEGLRVVPSTFITSNQLKVSRIDRIFGESLSSILLEAMP